MATKQQPITEDSLRDKGFSDDISKLWLHNKRFYPICYNKKNKKILLYSVELHHIIYMEQLEELWFLITNQQL